MTLFFRRFIGALVLDAGAFEDIEADRHAATQSALVVLMVCIAGGVAVMGLGLVGVSGFAAGAILSLGAWLLWASVVTTLGTFTMPEPDTRADVDEMLRVLGFASAPAVFIALAAMSAVSATVTIAVTAWTIAAAVIGVRQALDYRSTSRAIAVCVVAWLVSAGAVTAILLMFTSRVN